MAEEWQRIRRKLYRGDSNVAERCQKMARVSRKMAGRIIPGV